MIWLAPAVVVFVVTVPLLIGIRRVAVEAAELRRQVESFRALSGPVSELRMEADALRARVPELSLRTSPLEPAAS